MAGVEPAHGPGPSTHCAHRRMREARTVAGFGRETGRWWKRVSHRLQTGLPSTAPGPYDFIPCLASRLAPGGCIRRHLRLLRSPPRDGTRAGVCRLVPLSRGRHPEQDVLAQAGLLTSGGFCARGGAESSRSQLPKHGGPCVGARRENLAAVQGKHECSAPRPSQEVQRLPQHGLRHAIQQSLHDDVHVHGLLSFAIC